MDALIKISSSEFNEDIFKKLKSIIKSIGNSEITIEITNKTNSLFRKETKDKYWNRIKQSTKELEEGKGVVFTMDELEKFVKI